MLSKKDFTKFIKELKKLKNLEDNVDQALRKLSPDFGGFSLEDHTILVLDILQSALNDKSDFIGYFMYELEWGKKYTKECITDKKGKEIKLKTIEDLYNALKKYHNSGSKNA